ncbi:retropepsin-like aspartic protease [Pedobacter sp. KR3-3]|uniref:Retropepsin-like aspartic protease n=1 Tax=Pedobacter albus TaxID=3113905 RepID=A0ABU7I6Y1_9SPHI|nr:retropepsin-like aspartic protease [Pedobacter sp. KR3-3]MEE1945239.1 retropepsin-like aspartic protease [Pedobacter sp. KR3-3]
MNKFKSSLFVLLAFCSQLVWAQSSKPAIIPFQLTKYNNMAVKALVNHKDTVSLMFHTAASSLMLTEEATKRMKSLVFNRVDSVKSWGGESESRYSKSNSLKIGDLVWENLEVWEDKNSGQQTEGKFGPDLFENKVVEIDFDKSQILVYEKLPAKVKKYEKLPLSYTNSNMFITGTSKLDGKRIDNKFLIHSGYAGAILFDDAFVAANQLDKKLKIVGEKSLKDSYGNIIKTKKAILPGFAIGKIELADVPVGFFEGAIGRQKMSILGGDVLKRFNIIFDAQRTFVYLKANSLAKTAYSNI